MPAFRPRLRAIAVGAAAFALISVAAGGTLAASTNPPTLYACYNVAGQVALSDAPVCKLAGGGRLAYWSTVPQPGPTGPVGATGATGPTGPTGAQGPSGVRAWARIAGDGTILDGVNVVHVTHVLGAVNYCVYLDPAIDVTHVAVAVTPGVAIGSWIAQAVPGCGTYQGRMGLEVDTKLIGGTVTAEPGFSLVVP